MMNSIQNYLRHIARRSVRDHERMEVYKPHLKRELSKNLLDKIHVKLIGKYQGNKFYIVDGDCIRGKRGVPATDIDFCLGGNYGRYSYVPMHEFWLEDTGKYGIAPTTLHEYLECGKMIDYGWHYERAHDYASKYEKAFRKTYKPSKDIFQDFIKEFERLNRIIPKKVSNMNPKSIIQRFLNASQIPDKEKIILNHTGLIETTIKNLIKKLQQISTQNIEEFIEHKYDTPDELSGLFTEDDFHALLKENDCDLKKITESLKIKSHDIIMNIKE